MAIGLNSNPPIKFPGETRRGTKVKIAFTLGGDGELVPAASGKKIRLLRWFFSVNAAVDLKLVEETTGDLTGLVYLGAKGQWGGDEEEFVETSAVNKALQLNMSGAVAVGGTIWYEYFE